MRILTMLFIYLKRLLKKPSMWLMIAIMPAIAICVGGLGLENKNSVSVGLVAQCEEIMPVVDGLLEKDGIIKFVAYDDVSLMQRAVENTTLDCGYVFPQNIMDILKSGELKKSILVIESPSTLLSSIADEAVFAQILEFWSSELAVEYLKNYDITADSSEAKAIYNGYIQKGDTFELEIEKSDTNTDTNTQAYTETVGVNSFGMRGILAVFMLMGCMLGAMLWNSDEKRGLIDFGYLNIVAIEILLAISAIATVTILSGFSLYEIIVLVIYAILLIGFGVCLKCIVNKNTAICGMLPVLAIGALVFTPVFFDMASIINGAGIIERFFAPSYYLRAIEGIKGFKVLILVALGVNIAGVVLKKIVDR